MDENESDESSSDESGNSGDNSDDSGDTILDSDLLTCSSGDDDTSSDEFCCSDDDSEADTPPPLPLVAAPLVVLHPCHYKTWIKNNRQDCTYSIYEMQLEEHIPPLFSFLYCTQSH